MSTNREPRPDLTFLSQAERTWLQNLLREISLGNVVLFAGAGLSRNARRRDGGPSTIPVWQDLAERLLAEVGAAPDGPAEGRADEETRERQRGQVVDPLKAASYFEARYGRAALVDALAREIQDEDHLPGRVHERIVELNFREIITTNFDTLLERAFELHHLSPQVVTRGSDLVRRREPPRIIKMNGCLKINPTGMVITSDDFLAYSPLHPLIELFVLKSFVESTVLFIGFGLDDPAFRAINEQVKRVLGKEGRMAYSLQLGCSEVEKQYWRARQVQIVDLLPEAYREPMDNDDLKRERRLYSVLTWLVKGCRRAKHGAQAHTSGEMDSGLGSKLGDCAEEIREERGRHTDGEEPLWSVAPPLAEFLGQAGRRMGAGRGAGLKDSKSVEMRGEMACLAFAHDMPPVAPTLLKIAWLRQLVDQPQDLESEGKLAFLQMFLDASFRELAVDDMEVRSWYFVLSYLFAPMETLSRLVEIWTGPEPERALLESQEERLSEEADRGTHRGVKRMEQDQFTPTPMEYRLPILAFYGFLDRKSEPSRVDEATRSPGGSHEKVESGQKGPNDRRSGWGRVHFEKALDSLWFRHLSSQQKDWNFAKSDGARSFSQEELLYRYRYLLWRAAPTIEDWPSSRLQLERLENVAARLFMDDQGCGAQAREKSRCADALWQVLRELVRGWIFGSTPPRALDRAWEAARQELESVEAQGSPSHVPWVPLLVVTLALDGRWFENERQGLLLKAWQRGEVDAAFLLQYVRLRVEGRGFAAIHPRGAGVPKPTPPIGHYEIRLAEVMAWLADLVGRESEDSLLRATCLDLVDPIQGWLDVSPYPEVRQRLLEALASMRLWDPAKTKNFLRKWIDLQLRSRKPGEDRPQSEIRQRGSLELVQLAPPRPGAELPVEPDQMRLLVAHASSSQARGTPFRRDLEEWLIGWSELDSLEEPVLEVLSEAVSGWLIEGAASNTFYWLRLASQVQKSPPLLQRVEERLQRETGRSDNTLFHFVHRWLEDIEKGSPERWKRYQDTSLLELAPFFPKTGEEFILFISRSVDPADLNADGCDGAARLLTLLIHGAPDTLLEERRERWLGQLEALIREGATGRGALGAAVEDLSLPVRQTLQDNLLRELERQATARPPSEVIRWMQGTVENSSIELTDVEERLVAAVASTDLELAEAALTACIELSNDREEFAERNRTRLRRVRLSVEARGGHRRTSRFAELLARLPGTG